MADNPRPHAFLSYVHEDVEAVNRLERVLEAAGVEVWRDKANLWPGQNWKMAIRDAITKDALLFVACFSTASVEKELTYQREELLLAVDEYRKRSPDVPWIFPVRFDDCAVPFYDLGAGRDLDSLQRTDLFGPQRDEAAARLLAGVLRLTHRGSSPPPAPEAADERRDDVAAWIKGALLEPSRAIELDDFVSELTATAVAQVADRDEFPTSSEILNRHIEGSRYIASQTERYMEIASPLAEVLSVAGAWGVPDQDGIWTRAMESIANTAKNESGMLALLGLRRVPALAMLYSTAIASVARRNYGPLRAVAVDAEFRADPPAVPFIAAAHVYRAFQNCDDALELLARTASGREVSDDDIAELRRRGGRRHTPISDYLHARLRPTFSKLLPSDDDYTAMFDRAEVLMAALAVDARNTLATGNVYADGAWYGAFTWRDRFSQQTLEVRILEEAKSEGDQWRPLRAGLFGGDHQRAVRALEQFAEGASEARRHRW